MSPFVVLNGHWNLWINHEALYPTKALTEVLQLLDSPQTCVVLSRGSGILPLSF